MSKSSEQDQAYKSYMLESIDTLCMDSDAITNEELAAYVYETFKSEYQHEIDRYGRQKAFSNWLAGLPTVLTIAFNNHDILKLAVKFKSIPNIKLPLYKNNTLLSLLYVIKSDVFNNFRVILRNFFVEN